MKLNANATFIKIPLAQIRETGNVRHEYDEDGIKELAESIRNNGLMNPITVKPAQEDENGEKTYELIAGHRRIRAYKYLCDQGDDFSMVECCIRTGNKLVLQIIENIQRTDITAREKEDAIAEMLTENYSQADIARELSKPIQWVSDIVAGAKVRKIADYHGFDTENIATKTLSQLRTIPEDELYAPLEQLVMRGGTMKAATDILHEWKEAPIYQFREHQEEMRQLAEKMLTTNESSSEADDIAYSDDENMLAPQELTEAEWEDEVHRYDNAFAESMGRETPEHDGGSGQERFAPGTIISHAGKRLFFADLYVGKEFVHANDKNSAQHLKVCKVSKINDDCFKYIDGDRCCGEYSSSRKKYIDSEDCEHNDWIYEIPDDAVAVKVPDMQPVKTEPGNTQSKGGISLGELNKLIVNTSFDKETKVQILFYGKMFSVFSASFDKKNNRLILANDPYDSELPEEKSKGVKNPISKQIQTRWQVFCRSKKIAESEKTAFAFYQELAHFFEDTYEN